MRRIEAMEAKIAATEKEGAFYRKVVDFVHSNPPNDPGHMAHIDKVCMELNAAVILSDPRLCAVP